MREYNLPYNGLLMTGEGLDGCGKTTALEAAVEILNRKYDNRIVMFRDPGTSKVAEAIRDVVLHPKFKMTKYTEYYLYIAARAELVEEIKPHLHEGKVVVLDRFFDSTYAFQGFRNGVPLEIIEEDNRRISQGITPDLTLLYKITPKIAMQRNKSDKKMNRIDRESEQQHWKVYNGYEWLERKFKDRIVVIDASQSIEKVRENTVMIMDEFLANVLNPD